MKLLKIWKYPHKYARSEGCEVERLYEWAAVHLNNQFYIMIYFHSRLQYFVMAPFLLDPTFQNWSSLRSYHALAPTAARGLHYC